MLNVDNFKVEVHGKFGVIPVKKEDGSVGYDIALPEDFGNLVMPPNSRRRVDTGVIIKPPVACFTMVVPRSSSSTKNIRFSNTMGIIDPSYCGQEDTVKVDLTRDCPKSSFHGVYDTQETNFEAYCKSHDLDLMYASRVEDPSTGLAHVYIREICENDVVYKAGERFCQILFLPFYSPTLAETPLGAFSTQNRGGYGSTGQSG